MVEATTAPRVLDPQRLELAMSATSAIGEIAGSVWRLFPDGEDAAALSALMKRIGRLTTAVYYVLDPESDSVATEKIEAMVRGREA